MTILEQLASLVAEGAPTAPECDRINLHMIDSLAAWIAASEGEDGLRILRFGQTGRAPVLFGDSVLDEIARRVAIARSSEIDDIHLPSCTTGGAVIVQTALPLAKDCGATPETFVAAIWAGYQTITRLGAAVQGASILYRGIWPTYFLAPPTSAAVAARLMGLSSRSCANALGMATTMASGGVGAPTDYLVRFLQAGLAARSGVAAALSAAEGVEADRTLLDGDWLSRVHGIDIDAASVMSPERRDVMDQLSMKPFCAAKQTIAAIDGFRRILNRGRAVSEITEVRVSTPPAYAKMIDHTHCATRGGRITSLAYQLALAALRPDMLTDVKRMDLSGDPGVAAFMKRIRVTANEDLTTFFPQAWPARVDVSFTGGARETVLVIEAEGDPGRSFQAPRIETKFRALVDPVLGENEGARLFALSRAAFESQTALERLLVAIDGVALGIRGNQPFGIGTASPRAKTGL